MAPVIKSFPADSLEHKAYASLDGISFTEPNDRNRLGYHVFLYLNKEIATLEEAIHVAQARMTIGKDEAHASIDAKLREMGIEVQG